MRNFRPRTCDGRSVNRFSRTTKGNLRPGVSSREEITPCCRLQGQHGTIHSPQARSFTNRKRRKSSRPIYDAVSSLEEHEQADRPLVNVSSLRSNYENATWPNISGTHMWRPTIP